MRGGILNVIFIVVIFLLSLSVIRSLLGAEPLTFSGLLDMLKDIDIDFSSTLGTLANIGRDFSFTDSSFWDAIKHFFSGVYDILSLPLALFMDFSYFVLSVASFLVRLVGFNFLGVSSGHLPSEPLSPGFGSGFGGGGFGGGGGHGT